MELNKDAKERSQQIVKKFDNPDTKVEEVMAVYDAWHENYDKDLMEIGYNMDKHLDEFEDFVRISKDARILDVAAGTGLSGQKLKGRGYTNIDALDGSKGMLEKAKEKGIYKNYIHAMLGPQPIEGVEKDTYDTAVCIGALSKHHVRYDSFESLITITKPGGYIYFLGSVEWLFDERDKFEEKMRKLQDEGKWRWVLMKESQDSYYSDDHALIYAFKVLK